MDGLLSLLLFAGLFFLMMRFGCGAHVGHGGHGMTTNVSVDPVCGMDVPEDKGYAKVYQGKLYRFCTKSCLDKFDANPQLYLEDKKEKP